MKMIASQSSSIKVLLKEENNTFPIEEDNTIMFLS